jgi:hypothetical protein
VLLGLQQLTRSQQRSYLLLAHSSAHESRAERDGAETMGDAAERPGYGADAAPDYASSDRVAV